MFSPKDDRRFCLSRVFIDRLWPFVFVFSFFQPAFSEPVAIIITGISGNETDDTSFSKFASDTRLALIERGIADRDIRVLTGAKRDAILSELAQASAKVKSGDDFWLVLFGHSRTTNAGNSDDMPAFQVRGPRLTALDLKDSLAKFGGGDTKKWIFIGTEASGAYLPYLKLPGVTVLTATAENGEINAPRLPEKWAAAFRQNPKAPFAEIAARATQSVEAEYENLSLAISESGRLLEGETGRILSAPYGIDHLAAGTSSLPDAANSPLLGPEAIDIPKPKTSERFQFEPATEETKRRIAEALVANQTENRDGYEALVLRQEIGYTINSDHTTLETKRLRVFLATDQSLDSWANYILPQSPPAVTSKLEGARIILPDGSSWLLNPEKSPSTRADNEDDVSPVATIYFPQAVAGSLIEIAWTTDTVGASDMPEFYEEMQLQQSVPVISSSVTLKLPKKQTFHYRLANFSTDPATSETELSRVLTWQLPKLAALESLPWDPPSREMAVWLGVSSVESWDAFAKWYYRLSAGADIITPPVAAKAKEIAAKFPERRKRIQAVYEFVSALRYIAIELGIQGFRPRTPEQTLHNRYGDCKDKANLVSALLRAMDIPAKFALVNRGSSTDRDFPGWQFNHAIAFVPADKRAGQEEDWWLDSTDVTTPFGFVPPGDIGRQALVFDGEKAEFREVTLPGGQVTGIVDEWTLHEEADGSWTGKLRRTFTGLADYMIRQQLRMWSPKQRDYFLSKMLTEASSETEFSKMEVRNAEDLSIPVVVECDVLAINAVPKAPFPFEDALAPRERDRPLVINDGQPWHFRQKLTLTYRSVPAARKQVSNASPKWVQPTGVEANKFSLKTDWKTPITVTRIAELEINQPRISSDDYAIFRNRIRTFTHLLSEPPSPK